MFTNQDIKRLSNYLLEVFKDAFATKEDIQQIEAKIDTLQTSFDKIAIDNTVHNSEIKVLNYRVKNTENWIEQSAPKIGVEFKQ